MTSGVKVDINIDERKLEEAAKIVLWKAVNKMVEIAKEICAVDTGLLRERIHLSPASPGEIKYIIGDGVTYGVHVEFGTYKMDAQPFFRPAMDQTLAFWIPRFWKEVSERPEFSR